MCAVSAGAIPIVSNKMSEENNIEHRISLIGRFSKIITSLMAGVMIIAGSCIPQYAKLNRGSHDTSSETIPDSKVNGIIYGIRQPARHGWGLEACIGSRETVYTSDPGNPSQNESPYESGHSAVIYSLKGAYHFPKKGRFRVSVGFGFEGVQEFISTDVDFGAPMGVRNFKENEFMPGVTATATLDVKVAKQFSAGFTVGTSTYSGKDRDVSATTASFDFTYNF